MNPEGDLAVVVLTNLVGSFPEEFVAELPSFYDPAISASDPVTALRMQLRERGFPIIMEELYWCRFLAHTFGEVPVTLTSAERATSFRYRPSVFWDYLRYPLRAFFGVRPDVNGSEHLV